MSASSNILQRIQISRLVAVGSLRNNSSVDWDYVTMSVVVDFHWNWNRHVHLKEFKRTNNSAGELMRFLITVAFFCSSSKDTSWSSWLLIVKIKNLIRIFQIFFNKLLTTYSFNTLAQGEPDQIRFWKMSSFCSQKTFYPV